jgi:hypothetical protein
MSKFRVGDLVRNRQTNEDGKVTACHDNGSYDVSISKDQTSWMLGSEGGCWEEANLEISTNEFLRDIQ